MPPTCLSVGGDIKTESTSSIGCLDVQACHPNVPVHPWTDAGLLSWLSTACCSNSQSTVTSFILDLSTVRTTNTASYNRWPSFPACTCKSMVAVTSAWSLQIYKLQLKTPFFCLILVIFLLGLLLYCKVTEVRCIFHFNWMYVCLDEVNCFVGRGNWREEGDDGLPVCGSIPGNVPCTLKIWNPWEHQVCKFVLYVCDSFY